MIGGVLVGVFGGAGTFLTGFISDRIAQRHPNALAWLPGVTLLISTPLSIAGYMAGTVDELAYPLLLASYGVPPWLLKLGFGHSEMYWYRVLERLGRNSLVGTTVRDAVPRTGASQRYLRVQYTLGQ